MLGLVVPRSDARLCRLVGFKMMGMGQICIRGESGSSPAIFLESLCRGMNVRSKRVTTYLKNLVRVRHCYRPAEGHSEMVEASPTGGDEAAGSLSVRGRPRGPRPTCAEAWTSCTTRWFQAYGSAYSTSLAT